MYLDKNIFKKYWNILKRNYKDKYYTEQDAKYYYAILREYKEEDFIKAIKMVLKYCPYFPRVDEIVKFLPNIDGIPEWFNQELHTQTSESDKEEMKKILKEMERMNY